MWGQLSNLRHQVEKLSKQRYNRNQYRSRIPHSRSLICFQLPLKLHLCKTLALVSCNSSSSRYNSLSSNYCSLLNIYKILNFLDLLRRLNSNFCSQICFQTCKWAVNNNPSHFNSCNSRFPTNNNRNSCLCINNSSPHNSLYSMQPHMVPYSLR